jgi:hypothetical protein
MADNKEDLTINLKITARHLDLVTKIDVESFLSHDDAN